jgi:hypothetical protein
MKKFAAAILAIFYLSTSTGANIHTHYCMGEMADWGLGNNKSKTCDKCGMEKSEEKDNGCCKDEHKFLKNTLDQKVAESSFLITYIVCVAIVPDYPELTSIKLSSLTEENPRSNAPPRSSGVAVYILNRTFLI